jgi:hypothetical protein
MDTFGILGVGLMISAWRPWLRFCNMIPKAVTEQLVFEFIMIMTGYLYVRKTNLHSIVKLGSFGACKHPDACSCFTRNETFPGGAGVDDATHLEC